MFYSCDNLKSNRDSW